MAEKEPFEVGNTVLAEGRITRVDKVYKNGNFKLAGIDGQWRQGGWKAGDHGYHTPHCEHYTEKVAQREARRRAETRLRNVMHDVGREVNHIKGLSDEDLKSFYQHLAGLLAKIAESKSA